MRYVYTRQAKSFLVNDLTLYNKGGTPQLVKYAERMTHAIRIAPYTHRKAALNMARDHMMTAWAFIHRSLRPSFFSDLDSAIAQYGHEPMELPDWSENEKIHTGMYFALDVLEDFDRLTIFQHLTDTDEAVALVFQNWCAVAKVINNVEGTFTRIRTGKAFKGNQ